ncbi:hypothetical protein AXF42_Ash006129 [Apostasia shenzhenica]|uniref:Glucosidase II beta subunit N-terminal domain-containing protein n=1 Tax=Apostasia shenzhenica TaxID=1088818 RepID=A0A2I0B0A1_9ASPA|nr:hypothetical protein AXF42_Ash006129 [Apostasia shenzhenica]
MKHDTMNVDQLRSTPFQAKNVASIGLLMRSAVRCRLLAAAGLLLASFFVVPSVSSLLPRSSFLGISPQDERYYAKTVIGCRDGSKSFSRDRLNDGFCDCPDGTDEPGTSACPESKFYCKNVGDAPRLLFSSRVNDHICDCCDGSDEYDGSVFCQNTCFKLGAKNLNIDDARHSTEERNDQIEVKESKIMVDMEELVQNLKGLNMLTMVELMFLISLLTLICGRSRARRRRYFWRN